MILKSIRLSNIRSYTNAEVDFPQGTVLLAGDIGSGKSTILQAVEFALFGIKRGELSGSGLLRHGKNQGYVELSLEIDGKDVLIKRNLKRAKDDIKQDAGYILIDGVKKEGTAIELKSSVFELLGYPAGLISKSKDLVYRYTVYTPQEQMKQILFEERELRLDTLRRVFGIDRYKRIRENSMIASREIKESIKAGESLIEDIEARKEEGEKLAKESIGLNQKLQLVLPNLESKREEALKKGMELAGAEKSIVRISELKKEIAVRDNELKNLLDKRASNKSKAEIIERQVSEMQKEARKGRKDIEEIKKSINGKNNEIRVMETALREQTKKINELELSIRNSDELKKKINELDLCPVCQQTVTSEHKHNVVEREGKLRANLGESLEEYREREKEASTFLERIRLELDALKDEQRNCELDKIRERNFAEKTALKQELEREQSEIKKRIGEINSKKLDLNKELESLGSFEKGYDSLKKELELLKESAHRIEIEAVSIKKEMEGIEKLVSAINLEIEKKEKIKRKLIKLKELHNWIDEFFVNLMSAIEKQVMLRLYSEFNDLFQQWFKILVEDETINARLDEEFGPIIEQNGYETAVENLSGGEKTSLALAYRLSLNKVINDFIDGIKTKDIIILDEPTDGFSTEQLDKVREVIDQLNMKQIIIVSHESKIEGFVDRIIRVRKEGHESSIA